MPINHLWTRIKGIASAIGAFGLNSFALLLLKNQSDKSLVYLICITTVAYVGLLIAEHQALRNETERRDILIRRTRLVFRWVYVAVYLTIISANLYHADWHSAEGVLSGKIIYQLIMVVFIALTVPRDMLWQKIKPVVLAKWKTRKFLLRRSSYSVHAED